MANASKILLESGTNELEIIEFHINYKTANGETHKQSYGINVAKVREIIRMPNITMMPNLAQNIVGVFELRKKIISAIDLSGYLYNSPSNDKSSKMIIAEFNKIMVGFIVQNVQRIHRISWSAITPPDNLQSSDDDKSMVTGIINLKGSHLLMLDVEKIVATFSPDSAIEDDIKHRKVDIPFKIISAEDSSTVRNMITKKLHSAGYQVQAHNDGLAAWKALLAIKKQVEDGEKLENLVDFVITDLEMPKMDGYTLTKNIKSDKILSKLPVILFSSLINPDILHKGKVVGADAQLSKPNISELLDAIALVMATKADKMAKLA